MKKLLVLFLFSSIFCKSQNWDVFNSNYRYNYKFNNSQVVSQVLFVTGTVQAASYTDYNLNLIGAPCQSGCPTITSNIGGTVYTLPNNQIIVPFSGQFLQKKIRKYNNGLVMLVDTAKLVLKPNCIACQTWLFDSINTITATCTAVGTKTIFGISDSIKTIIVGSIDTIILSKSFGVYQFPKLYNWNKYYRLVGIENAATYDQNALYGNKVPNFWDIYNYNLGDKFYFESSLCNTTGTNFNTTQSHYIYYQITGKTVSAAGYSYQVIGMDKKWYSNGSSWPPCTTSLFSSLPMYQIVCTNSINLPENGFYPNAIVSNFFGGPTLQVYASVVQTISPYQQYFNICRFNKDSYGRFIKQTGHYGCYSTHFDNQFVTDTFSTLSYTVLNNREFLLPVNSSIGEHVATEGLGDVAFNWIVPPMGEMNGNFCLKSAIINGDTLFGPMPPVEILLLAKEQEFQNQNRFLYPSPANNKLTFRTADEFEVEVFDVSCKRVKQLRTKNREEIDVSDLNEGIYFLHFRNNEINRTEKIIISR